MGLLRLQKFDKFALSAKERDGKNPEIELIVSRSWLRGIENIAAVPEIRPAVLWQQIGFVPGTKKVDAACMLAI